MTNSTPWSLRGPFPVVQFGTMGAEPKPIPSTLGLGVEFEFESTEFCMWRAKSEIKAVELYLKDFKVHANLKILADGVPRNRFNKLEIPFRDEKMFTFLASTGNPTASSGQFSLEVYVVSIFVNCKVKVKL